MRLSILATAICLSIAGLSAADEVHASIKKSVNIPAEGLGPALQTLAKERDFQLVYVSEDLSDRRTAGVVGEFTAEGALKQLLDGTGFTFRYVDEKTVTIVPLGAASSTSSHGSRSTATSDHSSRSIEGESTVVQAKGIWDRFRMAQAGEVKTEDGKSATQSSGVSGAGFSGLEEVIVTAQKREERLLDVPVPVTALSAQTLADTGQLRLQEYYSKIPGVALTTDGYGNAMINIRGLDQFGGATPTVGVTVDDIPYDFADVDPSDLARIEVLRGPQGTLYGANSMGGLLKYVTLDPSTDGVNGRVQVGTSSISGGEKWGYDVRASANVPLGDTFAVRVSGFTRETPGYIDNVLTGQRDVNPEYAKGGLLSGLWRPSDELTLKLSALLQHKWSGGSSIFGGSSLVPKLGDLKQSIILGGGGVNRTDQLYSAKLTAKLGVIDLTALSGYGVSRVYQAYDDSYLAGGLNQSIFGPECGCDASASQGVNRGTTQRFTQELRFSAWIGDKVEWLLGGFYSHADSTRASYDVYATDPASGQEIGRLLHWRFPSTSTDYATFADLTFHFSDRFDLQVGGRESKNKQTYSEIDTGPYVALGFENSQDPFISPKVHSESNSFTYLVTPRFKVSPDLMVYARLASGYRPGGNNQASGNFGFFPPSYKADKTENYEIGVKGNVLEGAIVFDASLYYISWKDIQVTLLNPVTFVGYVANGSQAKSQGVELSLSSSPLEGLTISGWIALNKAVLTKPFAPPCGTVNDVACSTALGANGNHLPFSTRRSASLTFEQVYPLSSTIIGVVGASASYVGDRQGNFASIFAPQRQELPGYAKIDLHGGIKYDSWNVDLFVNNLSDKRGLLRGGLDFTLQPNSYLYIQPRTVGLSATKSF